MAVAHGRMLRARHQGFAATRGRPEVVMSSILKMVLLGPSKARVLLVTARVPWLSAPGPIEEYRPNKRDTITSQAHTA